MKDFFLVKKINIIIYIILSVFLLIFFRIWHLSVIQKEKLLLESKKPQTRTILQRSTRGEILDRENNRLAINRVCYNASVYYSHIKQIPSISFKKNENGIKCKFSPRHEYIKRLSNILSKELTLDPNRVEDLIHSKASLLPHVPYVIKSNISEKEYYKLRMLERKYDGLHAEITTERYYPKKMIASDIVGYLGPINQKEYLSIANEIKQLQSFLEKYDFNEEEMLFGNYSSKEDVIKRLNFLKEKSYSYNDLIGKSGLEYSFEKDLRGNHGKKQFAVDIKGQFLKELDSSTPPVSGKNIKSTISIELQQFAENLLLQDEKDRENKCKIYDRSQKKYVKQKEPWIKGGSIIAMDPNTGEILALASYPRYDPNDFILSHNQEIKNKKQKNLNKWLETEKHITDIYDGIIPLEKELYSSKTNKHFEEKQYLNWNLFLSYFFPNTSIVKTVLNKIKNIKTAIQLQEDIETLLYFTKQQEACIVIDCIFPKEKGHLPSKSFIDISSKNQILNIIENNKDITQSVQRLKSYLSPIIDNRDKLFVIDLCRILVFSPSFSDELISYVGQIKLSDYWKYSKSFLVLDNYIKSLIKPIFHKYYFSPWKEKNQKAYIQEKRKMEKEKNMYAKPYIDYLNEKERLLFSEFWKNNHLIFMIILLKDNSVFGQISPELNEYLKEFKELIHKNTFPDEILSSLTTLKNELSFLDSYYLIDFFKTIRSFKDLDRPLYGRYYINVKNPLEKNLASSFYPNYGFSYARSNGFSQAAPLGSIFKLVTGYTALVQRYEYLKETNQTYLSLNPFSMIDNYTWDIRAKKTGGTVVGYTTANKPYTSFYKNGRLPKSSHRNIGQINLISALAQSSNPYFSILSIDHIKDPKDLLSAAKLFSIGEKTNISLPGEISGNLPNDLDINRTGLYAFAIGQHTLISTPLQAAVFLSSIANGGKIFIPSITKTKEPVLKNDLKIPSRIRKMLIDGMHNVIYGEKGNARPSVIKKLYKYPDVKKGYIEMENQFVGKTSTAEIMHRPYVLPSYPAEKYKHIWFGAMSFLPSKKKWDNPELVVIVYLKYGDGGKEAAPLAYQMIEKYREIKRKTSLSQ